MERLIDFVNGKAHASHGKAHFVETCIGVWAVGMCCVKVYDGRYMMEDIFCNIYV